MAMCRIHLLNENQKVLSTLPDGRRRLIRNALSRLRQTGRQSTRRLRVWIFVSSTLIERMNTKILNLCEWLQNELADKLL